MEAINNWIYHALDIHPYVHCCLCGDYIDQGLHCYGRKPYKEYGGYNFYLCIHCVNTFSDNTMFDVAEDKIKPTLDFLYPNTKPECKRILWCPCYDNEDCDIHYS